MDYRTHILGGVAIAYAATQFDMIDKQQFALLYGCCVSGSVLPDIDCPEAFVSRYIPIIPSLLYNTVGHRTLTHSILFMGLILAIVSGFNIVVAVGITLGIASHIALDLLSPHGVSFLYPFIKRRIKIM